MPVIWRCASMWLYQQERSVNGFWDSVSVQAVRLVNHEFPKHTMRQHGQEGHHRQAKVRADIGSLHPAKDGRMTHRIQRRTVDPWVEATDVDVTDLSSFDDHLMVVSDGLRAPSEDSFLQFEEFDEVQV